MGYLIDRSKKEKNLKKQGCFESKIFNSTIKNFPKCWIWNFLTLKLLRERRKIVKIVKISANVYALKVPAESPLLSNSPWLASTLSYVARSSIRWRFMVSLFQIVCLIRINLYEAPAWYLQKASVLSFYEVKMRMEKYIMLCKKVASD